jgi:hypothetical protein
MNAKKHIETYFSLEIIGNQNMEYFEAIIKQDDNTFS